MIVVLVTVGTTAVFVVVATVTAVLDNAGGGRLLSAAPPQPPPSLAIELVRRPFDHNDGRRPVGLLHHGTAAGVAAERRRTVAAVDPERRGRFGRQPPAARGDYGGRAAGQFARRAPDERERRATPAGRRRARRPVRRGVGGVAALQQGQRGRGQRTCAQFLLPAHRRRLLLLVDMRRQQGLRWRPSGVHRPGHGQYGSGDRLQRYVKRGPTPPRTSHHRGRGRLLLLFRGHDAGNFFLTENEHHALLVIHETLSTTVVTRPDHHRISADRTRTEYERAQHTPRK